MTVDEIIRIIKCDEYCVAQMRDNTSETGKALRAVSDIMIEAKKFYEGIKTIASDYTSISLKDFAKHINGAEHGNDMFSKEDILIAKENGYVMVTGYSDGTINLRGSMHGSNDCWVGDDSNAPNRVYVDQTGFKEKETPWYIDIYWCRGYASWEYGIHKKRCFERNWFGASISNGDKR